MRLMNSNPKCSVARDEQGPNRVATEIFTFSKLPRNGLDTVEREPPEFSAKPKIAIGRLRNCLDRAFPEAFANLPGRMSVLTDIKRRAQGESKRRVCQ